MSWKRSSDRPWGPSESTRHEIWILCAFLLGLGVLGASYDLTPFVHALFGADHRNCAFDGVFLLGNIGTLASVIFAWRRARESGRQLVENRRMAQALEVALKQADIAERAKTNLLAGMSHELRTPLNAILGFAELIKNDSLGKGVADCYAAYAEDIHRSGQTLLSHFDSILEFVRAETGEVVLSEEVVDLRTAFAAVQRRFAAKAADLSVLLDMHLPPRSLALKVDAAALRQMLSCLVSNAIRYNHPGGRVVLNAICDEEGCITLRVRDNGRGIDPGRVAQAMLPFAVTGVYARRDEGPGFGLAMTRALAGMHGADFRLESTPGEGTVAIIRFPRSRTAATDAMSRPRQIEPDARPKPRRGPAIAMSRKRKTA